MKKIKCVWWVFFLVLWGCQNQGGTGPKKIPARAMDPAQRIVEGRQLYLDHGCAVCHGKEGYGDGPTSKMHYPPPRDFRKADEYSYGNSVREIMYSIKYGVQRPSSAMPAFEHFTGDELLKLAEYIHSLQNFEEQIQEEKRDE